MKRFLAILVILTLMPMAALAETTFDGAVVAGDNPALCHPGTWYVEECTDFTQWLRSLCDKCERLSEKAMTGEAGTLTPDKARQLQEEVIQPARALLKKRTIDADTYRRFVQKYFLLTGEAK